MMALGSHVDKTLKSVFSDGYGSMTVRVVVLAKRSTNVSSDEAPTDLAPDEPLPERDDRPVAGYLERTKRGSQCCVFLINGQRQHAWDNQFIMRDLELKYLRNRMIVIVDLDGLKPEASAELMQGSRNQFYEGQVYEAVASRLIATLKGDPDLKQLEEEAEEEISSLQAGDDAVKHALDQLIQEHHDRAARTDHGHAQRGDESRDAGVQGSLNQSCEVVVSGDSATGPFANGPILQVHPDVATIRLKPNDTRRLMLSSQPDSDWSLLEQISLSFDPPVKELQVARSSQIKGESVEMKFDEPEDFDDDEYPIETILRATAVFKNYGEPRLLERRVVINRRKQVNRRERQPLKDDPTFIRVTSRQPIKIVTGGPDVHVKLRWDGKDELASGNPPRWTFRVNCDSPSVMPASFLTRPTDGRFELLIQASPGLVVRDQLKFDVEAVGDGRTLATAFLADVVEPVSPRKIMTKLSAGSQRRPPYDLRYVKREDWQDETCWGEPWTADDPGSFESPNPKSPLTIFVNQDMELLANYREALLSKKHAESTIQQRINRYATHVAFHLFQIYEKQKQSEASSSDDAPAVVPTELQMRDEIRRVARTMLKLMEVG